MHLFSRTRLQQRLSEVFADPEKLRTLLQRRSAASGPAFDQASAAGLEPLIPPLPDTVVQWLSRLTLLQGVPYPYLVPDEAQLPPESIRFFYLNMSWVDALIDGAMSLGRNLTDARSTSAAEALESAVRPALKAAVTRHLGAVRRRALGLAPALAPALASNPASLQVVTGFLLRSSVVEGYPGLGVNAYPKDGTPRDPNTVLLPILRLEQLGPQSGVLLCLIDGDPVQVDIHEPPEGLHYGLDTYSNANGQIAASKNIHTFKPGNPVRIDKDTTKPLIGIEKCFRPASPRVMMMSPVAKLIAQENGVPEIDSAEMGFEMTEGVGQVSFLRSDSARPNQGGPR